MSAVKGFSVLGFGEGLWKIKFTMVKGKPSVETKRTIYHVSFPEAQSIQRFNFSLIISIPGP